MPTLPFTVPLLLDLRDEMVEIKDAKTYDTFKKIYQTVITTVEARRAVLPEEWPLVVKNLSTHDGQPALSINNLRDFEDLMIAYSEFLHHISELKYVPIEKLSNLSASPGI